MCDPSLYLFCSVCNDRFSLQRQNFDYSDHCMHVLVFTTLFFASIFFFKVKYIKVCAKSNNKVKIIIFNLIQCFCYLFQMLKIMLLICLDLLIFYVYVLLCSCIIDTV